MTFPPPLPGPQTPGEGLPEIVPGALPARRERGDALVGILGDIVRTGRWEVGRRTVAYQLMGNLKLDLRDVLVPGETLEVEAYVLMGDVRVLVPAGTDVQVRGATLMGDGRTESDAFSADLPPTGSRVVVTVWSLMGNVRVRTAGAEGKLPRGWRWARG
ncbi:LiaF domain-containing protein [Ornithinimicrobium cerasi]|uniref:LiaF domain-containing protein n=1 Tax=Ornithinimicrobium cerasi TaxID=2248773 RepID=UPI000EFDD6F3|nr:LiaF domain-containing protein [Ornithinimicrobium cerasi]